MDTLVTGCAGFIGSHLTERLLAAGHSVVGIDCFNDNYARPQKLRNLQRAREWDRFDFVPIDLSRGALEDLVSGRDVVFHLAAEPGVRGSWGARFETYVRNNVLATAHVLDALRDSPAARLVFASSSSIYGQAETFPTVETATPAPQSPYGVTKLAAEHLCMAHHANHGVQVVALRYFSVFGPRQRPDMAFARFCEAALTGAPIEVYGDGSQTRDFTFVDDIVTATVTAAVVPGIAGRVYNVGGGAQRPLREALATIERLAGVALDVRERPVQDGDVRDTGADTTRAQHDLDFAPATSFEAGLAEQLQWVASTLAADEHRS